ncbi:MAG: cation:dicarboxylase symporter family transporter [Pseudomonadales bacterium]|nr:cation:dicarboxylase symporter family transporter [Pseudomonadales bacterium]
MTSKWFAAAIIGGAVFGWLLAVNFADVAWLNALTQIIQSTFLAALKMIVAPLIFFSLLSGVMQLREAGSLGRLGGVTLLYYLSTSAIAILVGLGIVFFIHPWTDYPPLQGIPTADITFIDTEAGFAATISNLLLALFANPFAALAELNILGILTAALLFGLAAAIVLPKDSNFPSVVSDITLIVYRIAGWVIATLPLGLFAIAFQLTSKIDVTTFISLAHFALVVVGATLFHGLVVLPLIVWLVGGMNPIHFLTHAFQAMVTALITSSSAATLPISIQTAQEKLAVSRPKAAFVLPLGATINMDGTALFEGIAVIFLAYMFGVPLDTFAIIVVFLVTMLAAAGAPGIPSGSMAGLQTVLLAVGIPLEAIALVLLIERPLDTIRTAINVEGDLVGAVVVEKWT